MTRKRSGKTLQQQLMITCSCCFGLGYVNSVQTECYEILRHINSDLIDHKGKSVTVYVHPKIFDHLNNVEYDAIIDLEKTFNATITIAYDSALTLNEYKIR